MISRAGKESAHDEWLTVADVIAEVRVPRSTFYRWRQLGIGPRSVKLPNGDVRIRRSWLDDWLRNLAEEAA
ncbi:helix-turn-helix transcriptional regulator [Parafrankia sp. FMc2]|uniref:helix-turn-helix transcriptional regulator n=1 Tax=Parafrankia sp. FMc2 TaxID=3233196 RepID=UPI0034D77B88